MSEIATHNFQNKLNPASCTVLTEEVALSMHQGHFPEGYSTRDNPSHSSLHAIYNIIGRLTYRIGPIPFTSTIGEVSNMNMHYILPICFYYAKKVEHANIQIHRNNCDNYDE